MTDTQKARVLVAYGGHGVVQAEGGEPVPCLFRRSVGRPSCGDLVRIRPADDATWALEEILPARNHFKRADARGRAQAVAANLDRVVVVIATEPLPSRDLLDRYLVAVHSLGLEPVIVLNKVELTPDPGGAGLQTLERLDAYRGLGYPVVRSSCKGPPGVGELEPLVQGVTSILVGQSGVGKSSLVRALVPDLDIQVGALSRVTGKGTHTTTTTRMYELPGGGHLIDSPGVWEYGLWKLEPDELAAGFPDFAPWLGHCRFNDCRHMHEPGCAIKTAVERGELPAWRLERYQRLLAQNEDAS